MASLQDQPPAPSKWPDIIFDIKIEIPTLTNLTLDIHEGILGVLLYLYLASLQDQPPAASRWPYIIFDGRIEIINITNLPLHRNI